MTFKDITGALICGGKSQRFGSDKRLYELNGLMLFEIGFRKLSQLCGHVTAVFREEVPIPFKDYPIIFDDPEIQGPMAGILSALAFSKTKYVLCLSCDTPNLSLPFLNFLCSLKEENKVILPRVKTLEPLMAVYPTSFYEKLKNFSQSQNFSLMDFIESLSSEQKRIVEPLEWKKFSFKEDEFENFNFPR